MHGDVPVHWPIFIISLPDAVIRRSKLVSDCIAIGLHPIVIDAIDGRKRLPAGAEAIVDRSATELRVGRPVSDGEIACALSHRLVYEKIISESLPGAIILEDDAIISPLFFEFITHQGYLKAEIIQMYHSSARVWPYRKKIITRLITLAALAENAYSTTGYSLSFRAARYLLQNTTPLAGLADWPCDLIPLSPMVALPKIVEHPPLVGKYADSDLEKSRGSAQIKKQENVTRFHRWKRFSKVSYWKRWWLKRCTVKVS